MKPIHLITAFDSSGSVLGGNDPVGQRFVEVAAAVGKVARRCNCDDELLSILHFDTPVGNDLIAAKLTDSDAISVALQVPRDGGGCSLLGSSLARAERLAGEYPNHRTILIALTDFQLFDPLHVWNDFVAFPGEVHAVVLGGGFSGFDNDQRVIVTKIERNSAPGTVAVAVFESLNAGRSATVAAKSQAARRRLRGGGAR